MENEVGFHRKTHVLVRRVTWVVLCCVGGEEFHKKLHPVRLSPVKGVDSAFIVVGC